MPIGTPIIDSNLFIKGVRGPPIKACGIANIHMVIGSQAFTVKCVVINDNDIDFPAGASIIVGLDLLATNQFDLSTSRWALTKQNDVNKATTSEKEMTGQKAFFGAKISIFE